MKKLYTIPNSLTIVIVFAVLSALCLLVGLIALPSVGGIALCCGTVIFVVPLVMLIIFHYLNCIVITSKGVEHKGKFYSWDEVYITMNYTVPNLMRNAYVYRLYFSDRYYKKEEINVADKELFCIDLTNNRLQLILQYYTKGICILKESPKQQAILQKVIEHNKNYISSN